MDIISYDVRWINKQRINFHPALDNTLLLRA
jgi:hypothetical protein